MKESNEHLDINLDFLSGKEPVGKLNKMDERLNIVPTVASDNKNKIGQTAQPDFEINWSIVFTVLFIIFLIGVGIYSSNSDDSNTVTPVPVSNINSINNKSSEDSLGKIKIPAQGTIVASQEEDVIVGEYSCSSYHSKEARSLNTDETEQEIDSANNAMEVRINEVTKLKDEIDNTTVNDYSEQWEIDRYNEKIDDYNSKLPAYNRDLKSLSARVEKYNSQIKVYNDYLDNYCTKRN